MSTTETAAVPVEEVKAAETPAVPEVAAEAPAVVSIIVPYSRHLAHFGLGGTKGRSEGGGTSCYLSRDLNLSVY